MSFLQLMIALMYTIIYIEVVRYFQRVVKVFEKGGGSVMKKIFGRIGKRFSVPVLAAAIGLGLCFTGCGNAGTSASTAAAKQADPIVGKYIPVVGEMMGVALTGDELGGFGIDLQDGGKAVMTIDGESHNVKWTSDDSTVTVTVDGEKITGERGEDSILFKDMLGMGMDLTFAKEGTPAADPALYLPESEKYLLQDWQSVSVTDILGDPTDEIAPDALKMSFRGDHTMDLTVEEKEFKDLPWSNLGDFGSVDSEDVSLSWEVLEDGIKTDYVKDGTYYTFFCPKDPAAYDTKTDAAKGEKETAEETVKGSETETITEEETEEEAENETETKEDAQGQAAVPAVPEASGEHGKAADSLYADYWDRDWYGWYLLESCDGDYENLEDSRYDICGSIFVEDRDTGRIVLWDEDGNADYVICEAEVSFGSGTTSAGCMKTESGSFLREGNLGHADWMVDPGASDVSDFDHMIEIDGEYEDEAGSFRYYIYLRPWGMDWEDVRAKNVDFLPNAYDSWYLDAKDGLMPVSIGRGEMQGADTAGVTQRIESFTVHDMPEHYGGSFDWYSLSDGTREYSLDKNTVLETPEELDGWEKGDDALSWMGRLCDEDNTYTPAGVYDITVTGDHIDIIHGLYWWD